MTVKEYYEDEDEQNGNFILGQNTHSASFLLDTY